MKVAPGLRGFRRTLIAGLLTLLLGAPATAQNSIQGESRDQSVAVTGAAEWQQKDFGEVDRNGNGRLDWDEVEQAYGDELAVVEWDRRDVMNRYDPDGNEALDETEYRFFLSGLYHNHHDARAGGQQGEQLSAPGASQEDMESFAAAGAGDRAQRGSAEAGQNEQRLESTTGPDRNLQPETGGEQFWNRPDAKAGVGPERERQAKDADERETGPGRNGASQGQDTSGVALVTLTTVESVPVSELQNREVVNLHGDQIGTVQDVVTDVEGQNTGLVVGTGGFFGVGEKKILVRLGEVQLREDRIIWQTSEEQEELENREEYNERDYISLQ